MASGSSRRARFARPFSFLVSLSLLATGLSLAPVAPAQARTGPSEPTANGGSTLHPVVRQVVSAGVTKPLRTMRASTTAKPAKAARELANLKLPKHKGTGKNTGTANVQNTAPVHSGMPSFDANFEGVGSAPPNPCGCLPPDTEGDVGANHYIQWVNTAFQVYDKATGAAVSGVEPGNIFWQGVDSPCATTNNGDPIVQYDQLADRWFFSQFAFPNFPNGPFTQCIALSQTGDPLGAYFLYSFDVPSNKLNDYPKFGIMPDAYYMTITQFAAGTLQWAGAGVFALEREHMLQGLPAQFVYFDLFGVEQYFGGMLPGDLEGSVVPSAGTPGYFAEVDDSAFSPVPQDQMSIWELHVDWNNAANATFGIDGEPNQVLPTDAFDIDLCGFNRSCIPQPGTGQGLDAISDRLMYRLQYRVFSDHATLVANHTVDVDRSDHAGVRWYEVRNDGSAWSIFQQGTFAPDSENRWMGSAAMDASGNLAVGYSVSSSQTFPSIRAAGRLASDPAGQLAQGESEMIAGTGSQTHPAARWGDYSALSLDPTDGCTFWYTNEYLITTSVADWHTRIGHFKFPNCTLGPTGTLAGQVTDSATNDLIADAHVAAGAISTTTDATGHYSVVLPVDTYDVTASAYGYASQTVNGVAITDGNTTTLNFALDPVPPIEVSGTVTDGSGHAWPLYARINIDGYPGGPVFTDPVTGHYAVTLVESTPFVFHVNAMGIGYNEETRPLQFPPDSPTQDFALQVDTGSCDALGYGSVANGLFEQFNTGALPDGWSIDDNLNNGLLWTFDDQGHRGNLTGGDSGFAIMDSDHYGPGNSEDTSLVSPVIDLSAIASPIISFNNDYRNLGDTADVDLSIDGGATWTNVWRRTSDARGPDLEQVDIPAAANQANVKVRFHFYDATWAWWWEVDNVVVGAAPSCGPIPGGLVVGNVTDTITGAAINGATITSDDALADTATSAPTPTDPGLDDGFYTLFSTLTGSHPFTATKTDYGADTETVNVVADDVVRQDFALGAGHLVVDPTSLEVTVPMGGTADRTLTISNDGTAAADFEIGERNLGSTILGLKGARVTRVGGIYSPFFSGLEKGTGGGGEDEEPPRPPNAPPWTGIADYPQAIMDNTADAHDGKVYSVGGFTGAAIIANGYVYDPGTSSWSPIANMANAREKPAAAFANGLLYVVGGWDSGGIPDPKLEIYDPATNTWTTGASVPTAFAAAAAVTVGDEIYVIGGCQSGCGANNVFVYDTAADSWSTAASYPEVTSWTHCGQIGGLIYCGGGVSDALGESMHGYVYDPGSDSWSPIANLPQTRWAGGSVAADGMLLISGGVTNNFSTITNEGFAYDPGSDSWSPIPNSNNVLYRGASACGFYRFGGSIGGFSPVADAEVLPGLDVCGAPADVTWLSEDPTSGTVPASGSVDVAVHFDAGVAEVTQPGDYLAQLTFKENTPYTVPPVGATMHVTPPASWGKLQGTVVGLQRCDSPGAVLANAAVHVDGTTQDVDLKTDANGYYAWWMDSANSPLSITVHRAGWVDQTHAGVAINPGQTTTEDFTLRLDAPCADANPTSFDLTLSTGESLTTQLNLTNDPAAKGYSFSIDETAYALDPLAAGHHATPTFSAAAPVGPQSVRSVAGKSGLAREPKVPGWFGANDLPSGAVRYAHAQCDGDTDHFYVFSGVDSTFTPSVKAWVYSASANAWTQLADVPAASEGPTATCDAGKIHVMGGDGTNQHFVYDIGTNTWTTAAPLPRNVWGAAAGAWNGKIYLIGGDSDFNFGGTSNAVNIYDEATDTWTGTGADMASAAVTPGFVQAAQYVYVVGGWNDSSPASNSAVTQRYDVTSDTWTTGPTFASARADLALAATDTALYAIAGDADAGGPFDASTTVERLTTGGWPAGAWAATDSLPIALSANSGGYCTSTGVYDGEVWSVGGANLNTSLGITGRTFFRDIGSETCPTIRSDVPWLSESPASGTVGPDSSMAIDVTVDATGLAVGEYDATLLISTSDPVRPEIRVPVHMSVVAQISLTAVGRKTAGSFYADLTWTGATGPNVDVFRNGTLIVTTPNDGAFTDALGKKIKKGTTFVYKICNAGTSVCSNEATVHF
jgi:N-acetylneuraminic acid mutarotase